MNVLTRKDSSLYWDLNGTESAHQVNVERGDDCWTLNVYLTRCSGAEEKAVRKNLFSEKGELTYDEFVDKHFIKFGGVEPDDPERHKMYLDEMPEIKKFIYEECIQGVRNDIELISLDTLEDNVCVVPTVQDMYDPSEEAEVQFKSLHYINMGEMYSSAYEQCVENRSSEQLLEIEVDFDEIEIIYDSSVVQVDGFLIGDRFCTSSNKEEWIHKIPFEYKFTAVDEAFKPVTVS